MKALSNTPLIVPSKAEIDAVKAVRGGLVLPDVAFDAVVELLSSPKRLEAVTAALEEEKKPKLPSPEAAPVARIVRPQLDREKIIAAARTRFATHGSLPTEHSCDEVPGMPGESWKIINGAGREGNRGLAKGETLAKLFANLRVELNLAERGRAVALTDSLLIDALLRYHNEHHCYPSSSSKSEIAGAGGIQWATVFRASYYGRRGFGPQRTIESIIDRAEEIRAERETTGRNSSVN